MANSNPVGHIASDAAHIAVTAVGTLAAQQQSAPVATPAAEAAAKAADLLIKEGRLTRIQTRFLIILHVSQAEFQLGSLKNLRNAEVTRQGDRKIAVNLYSPFHRHNTKKAKSLPTGTVRHALPQIFSVIQSFNGGNLLVNTSSGPSQKDLNDAANVIASAVRRALVVGEKEELATLQLPGDKEGTVVQGRSITMQDVAKVTSWISQPDDDETDTTITAALHIHAGALYDAEDPGTWLSQQAKVLDTIAADYPAVQFQLGVAIGAETLVQGSALDLVNFIAGDLNMIPYSRTATLQSNWAPDTRFNDLLRESDFLFLKNANEPLGQTEDSGEAAE